MNARRAPQEKSKRKEETSQVNGRHNRRVWRGGRTSGLGGRAAAAGRRGGVSFQGISTGLVTTTPIGPHKNLEMNALYTLGLNALRSTHTQSLRLRRPPPDKRENDQKRLTAKCGRHGHDCINQQVNRTGVWRAWGNGWGTDRTHRWDASLLFL